MLNLSSLNPQQRRAVETLNGPLLILAGAGTGKTRVITHRIAYLIEKGISPANILAVTFTNKAAREMKARVGSLLSRRARHASEPTPESPTICTFHSLGVRVLRQHSEPLGYQKNFVIYNESEQLGVIKKILSHISAPRGGGGNTDPQLILSFLSRYKNGGLSTGAFADENLVALAEHVRLKYETALRACNAVDFDDLVLLPLRLFQEQPQVLAACRAKYRHVMVDEYQDTNAAQFRLVHLLTQQHRNLCVVGDDDQSIYGWRGAEIANLLDMEKHFSEVKIIKLEQNYRSTNTILQAANALIKNNARRRAKQLWSEKGPGTKITLHSFADDDVEARTIVEEIEFRRQIQRVSWSAQAILFRTNLQSRPLETALRQQGVRYRLVGGQSFFDRREVKDFLAYLKVFLNPRDDVSLLRIANVPARGLSPATMERLLASSQERQVPVYDAMKQAGDEPAVSSKTREKILVFVEFIERTREWLNRQAPTHVPQSLPTWAEKFLTEIGYYEDLRRSEKDAETGENRVRNLKDLVATLPDGGGAAEPVQQLQTFLEELALENDREDDEENPGDAVMLITIHSCKGLEFPHVHIVGVEDGLLPHSRSKADGTLDEERRLFYVAMTRAMQTLTISYCLGRRKYGQIQPCHPSPFLKELPAELVERAEEKVRRPVAVDAGKSLFAHLRAAAD